MSYLNEAEDWERLQREQPMIAMYFAMAPRSLFAPPPGVDGAKAYMQMACACLAIWGHVIVLCALLGMCGHP